MAAAALEKAAKALGHTIKVETQGSVGAKNQLTPEDIAAADAVVIAAETNVDTSRFVGKRLYSDEHQAGHARGTGRPQESAGGSLSEEATRVGQGLPGRSKRPKPIERRREPALTST